MTGGGFVLNVSDPELGMANHTVTIGPVYYGNGGPVNPYSTLPDIYNSLVNSGLVGQNWPSKRSPARPTMAGMPTAQDLSACG